MKYNWNIDIKNDKKFFDIINIFLNFEFLFIYIYILHKLYKTGGLSGESEKNLRNLFNTALE